MNYTCLETLDKKYGRTITIEDWHRVSSASTPADLTDDDLLVIEGFGGPQAAATAREARTKALTPPVVETKALPAPVTPTAALLPSIDDTDDFDTIEGVTLWSERNAIAAVPVAVWHAFVEAGRQKRQQLEQRVAALEAKPHVKFTGTWKAGPYQPGDAATHAGGLWICRAPTTGEPTKDFVAWQLAVKSGAAR